MDRERTERGLSPGEEGATRSEGDLSPFRTVALRRKQPSHLSLTIDNGDYANGTGSGHPSSVQGNPPSTRLAFASPGLVTAKSAPITPLSAPLKHVSGSHFHPSAPPSPQKQQSDFTALPPTAHRHLAGLDKNTRATWTTAVDLLNLLLLANCLLRGAQSVVLNGIAGNDLARFLLIGATIWTSWWGCYPSAPTDFGHSDRTLMDRAVHIVAAAIRTVVVPVLLLGASQAAPFALHPIVKSASTVPFLLFFVILRLSYCVLLGLLAIQRTDWRQGGEMVLVGVACFAYGVAAVMITDNPNTGVAVWWFGVIWEVTRILAGDVVVFWPVSAPASGEEKPVTPRPRRTPKWRMFLGILGNSPQHPSPWDPRDGLEWRQHLFGMVLLSLAMLLLAIPQHQPATVFSLYSYYLSILNLVSLLPVLLISRGAPVAHFRSAWHLALHLAIAFTVASTVRLGQFPRAPIPAAIIDVTRLPVLAPAGYNTPAAQFSATRRLGSGTAALSGQVADVRTAVLCGWSVIWMLLAPAGFGGTAKQRIRAISRAAIGLAFVGLAVGLPHSESFLWTWTEARDSFMPLSGGTTVLACLLALAAGFCEGLAKWIGRRRDGDKLQPTL